MNAGDPSPSEVAKVRGRGVRTHHDKEVPGLGHTKLPRQDGLYVPGHQAVEDGVQQQHAQHLAKGEVVVHVDRTQEVSPLDTCAWNTHQETGLKRTCSRRQHTCVYPCQGSMTTPLRFYRESDDSLQVFKTRVSYKLDVIEPAKNHELTIQAHVSFMTYIHNTHIHIHVDICGRSPTLEQCTFPMFLKREKL